VRYFYLIFFFLSSQSFATLTKCGIDNNHPQVKKLKICEEKKIRGASINEQQVCYQDVYDSTMKEMKKKTIQEKSPTLRNLLTEIRKSFHVSNEPNRLLNYYESLELYRTASECQLGQVNLYSLNEESQSHEILTRECNFNQEQKKRSIQTAKDNLNNHYTLFEAGRVLNSLKRFSNEPDSRTYRSEPKPLAFQDCASGMPPGAYPPEDFIDMKKNNKEDSYECPSWINQTNNCSKNPRSNLSEGLIAHQFFQFGLKLQLRAFSEHLLTTNPKHLTTARKKKIKQKVETALSSCIENKSIEKESLINDFSINLLDSSYFSQDGYDKYEDIESFEVTKTIKKLKVTENYFNKVTNKFSKLSNYYQLKCGLSYWFPQWGYKQDDECNQIKNKLDDYNNIIISPLRQIIETERNRFPFLSVPLSGGDFGSSSCFTGILSDMAENPLSYVMYGKYSTTIKASEFKGKSKTPHYDPACGKPLWKGAGDSSKYKIKQTNSTLAVNYNSQYNALFKSTRGNGINDRPIYPSGEKLVNLVDLELDEDNADSELSKLKVFLDDLNSQPKPTKDEINLTKKLKQESNAGIEDALINTLEDACENPNKYGKKLMLNDSIGKAFFSKQNSSIDEKKIFCQVRANFIEESKNNKRNLGDATVAIGMIGFIHPVAAVTVLPVEFGLEYVQFKEAESDRQRNLSLALLGLEDFSKADKEFETLKSEELIFYGIIGAMALGGLGDIADFIGDASKLSRYKKTASKLGSDLSKTGADKISQFQRQIIAIEKSGLPEIEKRLEILDKWKALEKSLSPVDFQKINQSLGEKIDSIKKLLARDIKFDLAREFAKSEFSMFIDDLQSIEDMEDMEVLIRAYKKAKKSPENFESFVSILKRRGKSCGI